VHTTTYIWGDRIDTSDESILVEIRLRNWFSIALIKLSGNRSNKVPTHHVAMPMTEGLIQHIVTTGMVYIVEKSGKSF